MVGAEGLSKQAIIDAVKADHTYVKPFGPSGPDISLTGTTPDGTRRRSATRSAGTRWR